MSELIDKTQCKTDFRWQLLATVSALAIYGAVCTTDTAKAEESDRPTVWIELGGQLERVQSKQDLFLPPFLKSQPRPGFEIIKPSDYLRPARNAFGAEAKVIFAPNETDWSFLASVRFGRSNGSRHVHQQTVETKRTGQATNTTGQHVPFYAHLTGFGDSVAKDAQRHLLIDFMAGKDVGLGLGRSGTATFDFGVRVGQFTSRAQTTLRQRSDLSIERIPKPPNPFLPNLLKYATHTRHLSVYAQDSITRSFSGIGPSLSLTGSTPVFGSEDEAEIAFDWGINAAALFGRQKVRGNYGTNGGKFSNYFSSGFRPKTGYARSVPLSRRRSRIVPNVGGLAGLTFRHADAKVSFGYRADFFFGALDGGIAARNSGTTSFRGPFATISIGLGG